MPVILAAAGVLLAAGAGTRFGMPKVLAAEGQWLRAATSALYKSADGQKLYDKWFMQKIPPKGLNLNTPIGAELKHEFANPSDSPDPDSYKAM